MDELADELRSDENIAVGLRIVVSEIARAVAAGAIQRHEMGDLQKESLKVLREVSEGISGLDRRVSDVERDMKSLKSDFNELTKGRVSDLEKAMRDLAEQTRRDLTEQKNLAATERAVLDARISVLKWVLGGVIAILPPLLTGAAWFFSRVH